MVKGKLKFKKYLIALFVVILIAVVGAFVYYDYFREVRLSPSESNLLNQEPLCDETEAQSPGGTWRTSHLCLDAEDSLCKQIKEQKKRWVPPEDHVCCKQRGGECSRYEDGDRCTKNCKWNVCGDGFILDGEECDPPNGEIYEDSVMKCNDECKLVCKEDTVNPDNECQKCANEEWVNKMKDELTPFCEASFRGKSYIEKNGCNKFKNYDFCSKMAEQGIETTSIKEDIVTLVTKYVPNNGYNSFASNGDVDYSLNNICNEDPPVKCGVMTLLSPCKRNGGICINSGFSGDKVIDEDGDLIAEDIDEVIASSRFEGLVLDAIKERGFNTIFEKMQEELQKRSEVYAKMSESAKKKVAKKLGKDALNKKLSKKAKKLAEKIAKKECYGGKLKPSVEGTETDCRGAGDFCCISKNIGKQLFDNRKTNTGMDDKGNVLERAGNGFMKKIKFAKDNGLTVIVIPWDGGVYAEVRWRPERIGK